MSEVLDSGSFNKNYKVLKEVADWLSQEKEPDIDQLVPKVERAMQAYNLCKARLDAVQATLAQYLNPDGGAGEEPPREVRDGRPGRPSRRPTSHDDDDDMPF